MQEGGEGLRHFGRGACNWKGLWFVGYRGRKYDLWGERCKDGGHRGLRELGWKLRAAFTKGGASTRSGSSCRGRCCREGG